jgi:hypothetical protein
MAQYQHLPIYKTTYELLQVVTRATAGFSKAYKYSLGDKLRAEVVELVVYLYKANSSRGADRVAHAATFLERLQVDTFLQQRLGLRLHPNKTSINTVANGFDALGFVIRPHARYVRRATVRHAFDKLDGMCRSGEPAADIQAVANSYFGIFGQANAWRLRARMGRLLRRHGHIVALQNNRVFSERLPL